MELTTEFETYIELDEDTEVNVLVGVVGELVEDSFDHEFGNEEYNTISNVEIVSVINLDSNEVIPVHSLDKKQMKLLLTLAEVELEDKVGGVDYEELYG